MAETFREPDPDMMEASFDAAIEAIRKAYAPVEGETDPVPLSHFDSLRTDYDPFVLKALGASVTTAAELTPVRFTPPTVDLRNVLIDRSAYPPVVVQRSEVDFGPGYPGPDFPEDHFPLLAGRVVTYSAFAVSEEKMAAIDAANIDQN